jgi:hypothetical protein
MQEYVGFLGRAAHLGIATCNQTNKLGKPLIIFRIDNKNKSGIFILNIEMVSD